MRIHNDHQEHTHSTTADTDRRVHKAREVPHGGVRGAEFTRARTLTPRTTPPRLRQRTPFTSPCFIFFVVFICTAWCMDFIFLRTARAAPTEVGGCFFAPFFCFVLRSYSTSKRGKETDGGHIFSSLFLTLTVHSQSVLFISKCAVHLIVLRACRFFWFSHTPHGCAQ